MDVNLHLWSYVKIRQVSVKIKVVSTLSPCSTLALKET